MQIDLKGKEGEHSQPRISFPNSILSKLGFTSKSNLHNGGSGISETQAYWTSIAMSCWERVHLTRFWLVRVECAVERLSGVTWWLWISQAVHLPAVIQTIAVWTVPKVCASDYAL